MKIAFVANTAWYLHNFRRNLMAAVRAAGHEPVALAADDGHGARLRDAGFPFRPVPFTGSGTAPWREAATVLALRRQLEAEACEIALTWTPKGNAYTALALAGRPTATIANISGLGQAFVERSWVTRVASAMYRLALGRARHTFFQNADDLGLFTRMGLLDAQRASLLPGSGVDLQRFTPAPADAPPMRAGLRFLMVSRLLWEKGVGQYVEAARLVRQTCPAAQFAILGPMDASPQRGVPHDVLEAWGREGLVEYLGTTDDVRPQLQDCDCVVLPSYREGMPRSLLEAAAMERPVITTDAPGCRDCVVHGVTGYVVRPRDAADLARAMLTLTALSPEQRAAMGRAGRTRVELAFDERIVVERYLAAIDTLARERAASPRATRRTLP